MNREVIISHPNEHHPLGFVLPEQASKWREEHTDFMAAYNAIVDAEGLPLEESRSF
jgi:antitoxin CcdA